MWTRIRTMSFTVVSTFAGCGGSSLGYQMAGGKVKLAVEWDDNAVETYRLNFPDTPIYHGDITKLLVEEALELAHLQPGALDIFDGSPPCQGFSTAGKRQYHDTRNNLFKQYARLLDGFRPKVFVMENVSGMVKGKMKLIFADVMRTLKGCGYRVSCRLLNAMYFGVPQSRQRVIFVGVREDLGIEPSHPTPQTRPVTVREALSGIYAITKDGHGWFPGDIRADQPSRTLRSTPGTMRVISDSGLAFEEECQAAERLASTKWGRLWAHVPQGKNASYVVGSGFNNVVKPHPSRPAPTVTSKGTDQGYATMVHPTKPRALTIAEAKRLHSFPEDFQLIGSYQQQWARIGNSVPPLMAKAVAEHIRDEILSKV